MGAFAEEQQRRDRGIDVEDVVEVFDGRRVQLAVDHTQICVPAGHLQGVGIDRIEAGALERVDCSPSVARVRHT